MHRDLGVTEREDGTDLGGKVVIVTNVYDTTHNEVLFFGFTNCGIDD